MTLRWFWRAYFAIVTALLLIVPAIVYGSAVELAVAPVLTAQTMSDTVRETGTLTLGGRSYPVTGLCWQWNRVKRRPQAFYSPDIDVFVDTAKDNASSTIFNRDTGAAWARSGAVAPGQVPAQHWCVLLPPGVAGDDAVRVRQTARYPGWLNLWRLPVHLPDVVSPAGAMLPP